MLLISLVMLGFGAYCAYDWQVGYPRTKEIGMAYQKIKAENRSNYPTVWKAYAEPRGWPTAATKIKIKNEAGYDSDIRTQLIMGLITVPLGLLFAFKFVNESRRWVAMDATGITASGGHKVPWDSIKSLNEAKWKTKGIAWLHYQAESGGERRLLLDDFKSQRDPIKQIVARVQHHLDPELSEPQAQTAASASAAAAEASSDTAAQVAAKLQAGGLYAMREDDGQYTIAKVLVIDDFAVHIRTFAERFVEPPTSAASSGLSVEIAHAPIDLADFASVDHTHVGDESVAEEELDGYRVWESDGNRTA